MNSRPVWALRLILMGLMLLSAVSCSRARTTVVLLPDEKSPSGAIAVTKGDQTTLLDTPMTAARVESYGSIQKETVTREKVEKDFTQALAAQPPDPISFTLYFEEGTTVVRPESRETLAALFQEVAQRQAVEVQVTGHTDTVGSEADNDRLSEERAQAIREMLIEKGLKASFIRAVGRGERELLVTTPDNMREPSNRRVEVIVR